MTTNASEIKSIAEEIAQQNLQDILVELPEVVEHNQLSEAGYSKSQISVLADTFSQSPSSAHQNNSSLDCEFYRHLEDGKTSRIVLHLAELDCDETSPSEELIPKKLVLVWETLSERKRRRSSVPDLSSAENLAETSQNFIPLEDISGVLLGNNFPTFKPWCAHTKCLSLRCQAYTFYLEADSTETRTHWLQSLTKVVPTVPLLTGNVLTDGDYFTAFPPGSKPFRVCR